MLVDTHCHLNLLVDYSFDVSLTETDLKNAKPFVEEAAEHDVTRILNVGTSLIESLNSVELAKMYPHIYASVGIHPNDLSDAWQDDLSQIRELLAHKDELKILAIGECGLDKHYPDYNLPRQIEAFKKQIELALEFDLALVIHTRDAEDGALRVLAEYKDC